MFGSRAYTASSVRFGVALGRPDRRRKSWIDYRAEIGRSPEWTDEDRRGLRTP